MTGSSNTNDDALAPALVASLQGSAHDTDVASAVKGVVTATVGHLDQVLLDGLARQLGGVDKVGGTELAGPGFLAVVDINGDDLARLVLDGTLHDGQTDTASTEDSDVGALLDVGGHHRGTVPGGDTAAQQAGSVGGDLGSHSHDRDVGNNRVLGEGRSTHEVEDVLAPRLEARGAVGHDTLTLSGTDLAAEIGLARLAELALTAFGGAVMVSRGDLDAIDRRSNILKSDDVISRLDRSHALANRLDDTGALVSQDDGESTLGVLAGEGVGIWLRSMTFLLAMAGLDRREFYLCGRRRCGESECAPRAPGEEPLQHPRRRAAHRHPRRSRPVNRIQQWSNWRGVEMVRGAESATSSCAAGWGDGHHLLFGVRPYLASDGLGQSQQCDRDITKTMEDLTFPTVLAMVYAARGDPVRIPQRTWGRVSNTGSPGTAEERWEGVNSRRYDGCNEEGRRGKRRGF